MKTATPKTLVECEAIIERAENHQIEEARALRIIRDGRLYRQTDKTFDAYCRRRWGFSRQHVHRLLDHAEVCENLSPVGYKLPVRERHARPLVKLTPDQQRRAWGVYLEGKPKTHNAADIAAIAEQVKLTPVNEKALASVKTVTGPQTPLRCFGAKTRLASSLISLFPSHERYIEPFAGGAALLFRKPPTKVEIMNDLDGDIVNFFRVLREHGKELQRRLKLTPYSREEHQFCKDNPAPADEIERARRFFVRTRQSYGGQLDETWSLSSERGQAAAAKNIVDELHNAAERLRNVQIEQTDFRSLLSKRVADDANVLCYCDPPYRLATRTGNGKGYRHEMNDKDHADLLDIVTGYQKTKVAISGYAGGVYERLDGWKRYEFRQRLNVPQSGEERRTTSDRTEVLWCNWW